MYMPVFFVATTMWLHQLVGSSTGVMIPFSVRFFSSALTEDFIAWGTRHTEEMTGLTVLSTLKCATPGGLPCSSLWSWENTEQASATVSSVYYFRDLSWWVVASAARDISMHVLRFRSASCNSRFPVELSLMPRTMRSLKRVSFKQSQKLHVEERVRKAAM